MKTSWLSILRHKVVHAASSTCTPSIVACHRRFPMVRLAQQTQVSRRHFMNGATALAVGAAADSVVSKSAWAAPPDYVDLRDNHYVTPVKQQNSCNACTAFAVVATIEATYRKKFGVGTETLNLSEAQLFFAAGPKNKCDASHWWPESA